MMPSIRNYIKENRGQAVVEFALVLPIFVWLLAGMVDFGRVFHELIVVTHAAREGARVAVVGNNDTAITTAVRNAAVSIHSAANPVNVAVAPPAASRVAGQPITVTVTHNVDILTPFISTFVQPNPYPVAGTAVMR